jgi:Cu+-exporting ATPase
MVYDLLKGNNLGDFYTYEKSAGIKPKNRSKHQFLFLDEPEIQQKYISYADDKMLKINLYLPDIHCSSCIYLLENCHKLNPGIVQVMVYFTKKEAVFTINPNLIKLSELADLLVKIGYEPNFGNRLQKKHKANKQFLYKLGVAAFAFGNVMLWSVPEYGGLGDQNQQFRTFSAYLSLVVSIPVLLYSARDYFVSAYKSLKFKQLNLDVPITIGIVALYAQSLWSIFNHEGAGYMDSFTGFIFFLLIGKWFQNWSYQSLSFERDYKSYFPVAVTKLTDDKEQLVEIDKLETGDHILIRNDEIIPADSILESDTASIDFSFVTGESDLVHKVKGDFIYAGGKLVGAPIVLQVEKKTQRSHLTSLWDASTRGDEQQTEKSYQDKVSGYFLLVVLLLSMIGAAYWFVNDVTKITHVLVSILIVTCPCALALSAPFTLGNTMRLLGRRGLYLKNASVVEKINRITDIVFDKTGTLTEMVQQADFQFIHNLSAVELSALYSLTDASLHPVCVSLKQYLSEHFSVEKLPISDFQETVGKGVSCTVTHNNESMHLKLGAPAFVSNDLPVNKNTYISINDKLVASLMLQSNIRVGLKDAIHQLPSYQLHVLSGDSYKDEAMLRSIFPAASSFHFQQSPRDKKTYIEQLQGSGKQVMMIGDGLNDAGALKQAQVGIAVSENSIRFTPASDAIIAADSIQDLPDLLRISKQAKIILWICLGFSVCYNVVGLSYAFTGNMTPLVAAILMPISSITVVFISTVLVVLLGKKR